MFLERDGAQKLYFVLETKDSASEYDLRLKELLKIKCGKAHFEALETSVAYSEQPVTSWHDYKRVLTNSANAASTGSVVLAASQRDHILVLSNN